MTYVIYQFSCRNYESCKTHVKLYVVWNFKEYVSKYILVGNMFLAVLISFRLYVCLYV